MSKYFIPKEEIDALVGDNKTHFLNENASRVNKSLGDLTGLTGLGVLIKKCQSTLNLPSTMSTYMKMNARMY